MLVLSRRVNEQIVINGEIFITVLESGRNGQVRLGIQAPARYQIYRHEVLAEIQKENRDAADPAVTVDPTSVGRLLRGESLAAQPDRQALEPDR